MISSIRYESGHPDHPITPGRTVIELDRGGGVRVTYSRLKTTRAWAAQQAPALWPAVLAALDHAKFPAKPPPGVVRADSLTFSVTVDDQSVSLDFCPPYEPLVRLMAAIVVQTAGKEVLGYDLPGEPRYVTDVREETP
ncbi:MAG: hypothetical protein ACM31C_12555 [Acidobacteriota bacterium]